MVLSATTLHNLEIVANSTDGQLHGTLLWVMDHTSTPFGRRCLRQWITRPLINLT